MLVTSLSKSTRKLALTHYGEFVDTRAIRGDMNTLRLSTIFLLLTSAVAFATNYEEPYKQADFPVKHSAAGLYYLVNMRVLAMTTQQTWVWECKYPADDKKVLYSLALANCPVTFEETTRR